MNCCACYPIFSATSANKLSPRSVQCVFIGYALDTKNSHKGVIWNTDRTVHALPVCVTNRSSAGLPSDGGILGSVPHPVVYQICFSAGHSAINCPSRFTQPSAPALLTTPGDTTPAL
ncbi:unnamed protein product [Cuscuta europaea]|uniref:Retroviral polymerase SH3-like domain-containing protein n=1 Tax=Cuscuta europaea TaxID=41803 RepID=A0A9P0YRA6_CUSEU|nr:unnamed protein product [Cuscuta europaea]